jgi:penicillin-binding protein 2
LLDNPARPMVNKAVSEQYPPGSVFKTMAALAALENGYNPKKQVFCDGDVWLGRRKFHCWKKRGHQNVDMVSAIEGSCNIYFYKLGRRIGIKNIVDVAKKFGLGEKTGLDIHNEKDGHLPTKEWKKRVYKESWVVGDTYNSVIGQGFVEATVVQLAVMSARLASKGKKVIPSIFKDSSHKEFEDLGFEPANIDLVLRGMYDVVNNPKGTAYRQRLRGRRYKGFKMAGKTGTSQVVKIDHKKDMKQKDVDFERRNHGLFVGFAPFDKPKYAISVVVEHGGSGSGSAAPIARRVMQKIHRLYKL